MLSKANSTSVQLIYNILFEGCRGATVTTAWLNFTHNFLTIFFFGCQEPFLDKTIFETK